MYPRATRKVRRKVSVVCPRSIIRRLITVIFSRRRARSVFLYCVFLAMARAFDAQPYTRSHTYNNTYVAI